MALSVLPDMICPDGGTPRSSTLYVQANTLMNLHCETTHYLCITVRKAICHALRIMVYIALAGGDATTRLSDKIVFPEGIL